MPFTEQTAMDARLCFISACLRSDEAMSSLCLRYGISRKTGYKWLSRYKQEGATEVIRQIPPLHTCPGNPKHTVQNQPMVLGTTPPPGAALNYERRKAFPFFITHNTKAH